MAVLALVVSDTHLSGAMAEEEGTMETFSYPRLVNDSISASYLAKLCFRLNRARSADADVVLQLPPMTEPERTERRVEIQTLSRLFGLEAEPVEMPATGERERWVRAASEALDVAGETERPAKCEEELQAAGLALRMEAMFQPA